MSTATGPQFAPLVDRTKGIVVVGAAVAGRLYDTQPCIGIWWASTDNSVSCSVQW